MVARGAGSTNSHQFGFKMSAGLSERPVAESEGVPPTFGHALEDVEEAHQEVLDLRLLQLVTAEQAAAQGGGRLVLDGRRHQSGWGVEKQRERTTSSRQQTELRQKTVF